MAFASRDGETQARYRDATSAERNGRGYKVVVESVLEEKKQLKSHVCYSETAPPGYTFVPVGFPALTEASKELARKRGLDVLIVSAPATHRARLNAENISHHIHRIGHHFPNRVVDDVRNSMDYEADNRSAFGTASIGRRLDAQGRRLGLTGTHATAAQRSQQVAGAIKELFPRIPAEDCEAIIQRAFETGAKTVGNAKLPLARRVQLAVVAHIRHVHTDYDVLLRTFKWARARQLVEEPCLQVITRWRDETDERDDDLAELEKVFREVIVIDDSDNEDGEDDDVIAYRQERVPRRAPSLEVVGQRKMSLDERVNAVMTPPSKKRRTSPPLRRRSLSPILRSAKQNATNIISVRPQRGPGPRQVMQLDEMTRRAESWDPESALQYSSARTTQPSKVQSVVSGSSHQAMLLRPAYQGYGRVEPTSVHQQVQPPLSYASQEYYGGTAGENLPPSMSFSQLPPNRAEPVYHSVENHSPGARHNKRSWEEDF